MQNGRQRKGEGWDASWKRKYKDWPREKLSFFYFLSCGNCVPHLETSHTGTRPPLPLLTGLFNEHLITSNNSIHCTDHRISGRCPVAEIPSPPQPQVGLEKGGGGGGWGVGWGAARVGIGASRCIMRSRSLFWYLSAPWNFIIILCWSLPWLSPLWVANWPNIWLHNSKGAE